MQARMIYGDVILAPPRVPVPAQLPSATPLFTNRDAELRELGQLIDPAEETGPPRLAVIHGVGGLEGDA